MRFTISNEARNLIPNPVVCLFDHTQIKPPGDCPEYNPLIASAMSDLAGIRERHLKTPEVQGFRKLYPAEPAGERLLRVVEERKEFRRYNNLVDAINIASLTTITPLGSHDARDVNENTELHLKLADGTEQLVPSFQKKKKTIPKDEVTYGLKTETSFTPLAWLGTQDVDNRDFQIKEDTTRFLVTVIGHRETSQEHNVGIAHRINELIQMSCPLAQMTLLMPESAP